MAELKTKQHDGDVFEFINIFANTEQKREDSFELVKIMQKATGHPPKMWGSSMIGFRSNCRHWILRIVQYNRENIVLCR